MKQINDVRHIRLPDEIWKSMKAEAKALGVQTNTMIGLVWLCYLENKGKQVPKLCSEEVPS